MDLALFDLNQCIKVVVNHYCRQGVEDDISFIMAIILEFMKVLFYMIHTMHTSNDSLISPKRKFGETTPLGS